MTCRNTATKSCRRGDLNPHALKGASPSSWCVCHFATSTWSPKGPSSIARPAAPELSVPAQSLKQKCRSRNAALRRRWRSKWCPLRRTSGDFLSERSFWGRCAARVARCAAGGGSCAARVARSAAERCREAQGRRGEARRRAGSLPNPQGASQLGAAAKNSVMRSMKSSGASQCTEWPRPSASHT